MPSYINDWLFGIFVPTGSTEFFSFVSLVFTGNDLSAVIHLINPFISFIASGPNFFSAFSRAFCLAFSPLMSCIVSASTILSIFFIQILDHLLSYKNYSIETPVTPETPLFAFSRAMPG